VEDLIKEAQLSQKIVNDTNLPIWKRLHVTLAIYAKTNMTNLPTNIKKELENSFIQINNIFSNYKITKFEDYKKMAGDDLFDATKILSDLSDHILKSSRYKT
jgi:hypothetical protein